jgi:hypothetical protein
MRAFVEERGKAGALGIVMSYEGHRKNHKNNAGETHEPPKKVSSHTILSLIMVIIATRGAFAR